jgi:hypothetical protein
MRQNSTWKQINRLGVQNAKGNSQPFIAPSIAKRNESKGSGLITGGIGDFLAIEPFVTNKLGNLEKIYLATRGHFEIAELIRCKYTEIVVKNLIPIFPKDQYCFTTKTQLVTYLKSKNMYLPPDIDKTEDMSIIKIFPQIHNDTLKFLGSRFNTNNIVNIEQLNLPKNYVAMVSSSLRDARTAATGRNMTTVEIANCLNNIDMPVVCVFCNCSNPHPAARHLRNTSVLQSLEIVKNATGYIGVDSWLSVVAGWKLAKDRLQIKCINQNGITNKKCYWPLHEKDNILFENLLHEFKWGPG